MCLHVVWVEAHSVVIVGHGTEVIIEVILHVGTIDKVAGIVGFEFDGLVHVGQRCLVVVLAAHLNLGAHDIGTGVVLRQLDASCQIEQCSGRVFSGQVEVCQSQVGTVVLWVEFDETVVTTLCLIKPLEFVLADRPVHQEDFLLGHEFQSLVIVGDGSLKVSQVLPGHTAHLIGIDNKGVAVDGQRRVGLGPLIVLEVDLGHSTIEVWLGQEWFDLDDLVEVLYGEDVILKIE